MCWIGREEWGKWRWGRFKARRCSELHQKAAPASQRHHPPRRADPTMLAFTTNISYNPPPHPPKAPSPMLAFRTVGTTKKERAPARPPRPATSLARPLMRHQRLRLVCADIAGNSRHGRTAELVTAARTVRFPLNTHPRPAEGRRCPPGSRHPASMPPGRPDCGSGNDRTSTPPNRCPLVWDVNRRSDTTTTPDRS